MKRYCYLLLVIVLLLTGCSNPFAPSPPQTEAVETVEMVTETYQILLAVSVHYPDGRKFREEFEYDNYESELPAARLFYENGEYVGDETYTRDQFGNVLEVVTSRSGYPMQRFELTCDEQGRILEKLIYEDEQYVQTLRYSYDEAGNVLTESVETDHVELTEKTYDDQNRVIEERFSLDGALQYLVEIQYGEDGRRSRSEKWAADGTFQELWTYSFDTTVRREQEYHYNNLGELMDCMVSTFNPDGLLIREDRFDAAGTLQETKIWRYLPYTIKKPVE